MRGEEDDMFGLLDMTREKLENPQELRVWSLSVSLV